jgi:hypothetical protein
VEVISVPGEFWLPPVEVPLPCGPDEHALRWADGELTALHHEDIDGELALGALGGAQIGCARILQAWRTAMQEPRLFTLASRGKSDQLATHSFGGFVQLGAFGGGPRRMRGPRRMARTQVMASARPAVFPGTGFPGTGFAGSGALVASGAVAVSAPARAGVSLVGAGGWTAHEPPEVDPLVSLLQMPALADRLLHGAILAWSARLADGTVNGDARPTLTAALIARVRAAARDWFGDPKASIEVEMLAPAAPSTFAIDGQGTMRVGVPFRWLADVWAAQLFTIYGRFTLGAERVGRTVTLDTVGPDLTRAPIVIRLP